MTRRIFLILSILAIGAGSCLAQAKLSPAALVTLQRYENPLSRSAAPETVLATIEINSPEALDSLRTLGAEVRATFGEFAIVNLPVAGVRKATTLPSVRAIDFGTEARPLLDKARAATGVDAVHAGEGLDSDFAGRDVVVGVVDQGLDPLHPAFLDADGNPRVKLFAITDEKGVTTRYRTPTELRKKMYDVATGSHGTHVTGIAAGSRIDNATKVPDVTVSPDGKESVTFVEGPLPYYGVAPEADIVMTGGSFSTSALLLNAKEIIDYADSVGKPAVINMSLGTTLGSHNGLGTFSRAIEVLGRQAIFTLAAGNEAEDNISLSYTFKTGDPALSAAIDMSKATTAKTAISQIIEIQGEKGKPLAVNFVGFNKTTGEKVFTYDIPAVDETFGYDDIRYIPLEEEEGATKTQFFRYFSGEAGFVVASYAGDGTPIAYIVLDEVYSLTAGRQIAPGFEVTSDPGTRIDIFLSESDAPFLTDVPGLTATNYGDMSISDMATGKNIVTIGSYNTRDYWPTLDGNFHGYNEGVFPIGEPSYYSSYGVLRDGRSLPHVAAPGAVLISAYNRWYTRVNRSDHRAAEIDPADANPVAYYDAMQGTSMASPFAAGVIALWLEANPDLTVDDILDIISHTSVKDKDKDTGTAAIKLGAGRIDALAGIKEALALRYGSGIGSVETDLPAAAATAIISMTGTEIEAFAAGSPSTTLALYSPSGACVATASAPSDRVAISTSSLAPGIYIARAIASDGSRSASRKIAIR